ncbi:MAG: hypothetical protein K0R40_3555, partial [Burkholderiales bacterium]|nr:hypothetical protein [Burkholderiales bacterium]
LLSGAFGWRATWALYAALLLAAAALLLAFRARFLARSERPREG